MLCVVVLWVVVEPVVLAVEVEVSVLVAIEVSAGGDELVVLSEVVDSVVVVLWPQAARPTSATAKARSARGLISADIPDGGRRR